MSEGSVRFYVGSDHGGVSMRDALCAHLRAAGHEVVAVQGPRAADEKADYPDVAHTVARAVLEHDGARGLLVCGTGQGMAISANKVRGIRAGVVSDPFSARMLRSHNDAQILCLGERVIGIELAKVLLDEFIRASFEGGRHQRRVDKIEPEGDG